MSARGWLVTSPGARSRVVAESKRYIPLLWLSFLSPADIEDAEHYGQFLLDRKRAIERSSSSLPFLGSLFPHVASFSETANSFLEKLRAKRSKTIGIEVVELVGPDGDDPSPDLVTAVGAIATRNANYSLTIPARTIVNPFNGEELEINERRIETTQDMLFQVCMIPPADLASESRELVRSTILGYVYPGAGL
jgi:hypothetical protein